MKPFSLILALACAIPGLAATPDYTSGKLLDLRRESTNIGPRNQISFCMAIAVGDMAYLARQVPNFRWSYEPTDFIVGDSVDVEVKGKNLFIRRVKGGDLKTSIVRRERIAPGQPPINCGLPVTAQN